MPRQEHSFCPINVNTSILSLSLHVRQSTANNTCSTSDYSTTQSGASQTQSLSEKGFLNTRLQGEVVARGQSPRPDSTAFDRAVSGMTLLYLGPTKIEPISESAQEKAQNVIQTVCLKEVDCGWIFCVFF